MTDSRDWGDDLIVSDDHVGLESLGTPMVQGNDPNAFSPPVNFKPVNIVIEHGLHYATIYVCGAEDSSQTSQKISMWLSSLKETDYVHASIMSLMVEVPVYYLINLMSAFASTKATINMRLDHIVSSGLAYFYLLADTITKGSEGALYIPSYKEQRDEDLSGPMKANLDFYRWVVDDAVSRKVLTAEEASRLHRGLHVVVPDNRFHNV